MSPIVPGRVRQASYPNRPCLLQQLWTSPHLSAALLLPLLLHLLLLIQLLPFCLCCCCCCCLLLLNINPAAAGSGRKEVERRGRGVGKRGWRLCFKRDPRTKDRNGERISDSRAELTGVLHGALERKQALVLRGLSFSITVVISVGLRPARLR